MLRWICVKVFNNNKKIRIYMSKFMKGGRGGGRDSRPVTMHETICDSCKKSCEVPFRPSGDKPVYCSNCFSARSDSGSSGSQGNDRRNDRRDFSFKQPSYGRPQGGGGNDEIKKQLERINEKLERLIIVVKAISRSEEVKKVDTESSIKVIAKKTDEKGLRKAINNAVAVKKKVVKKAKKK